MRCIQKINLIIIQYAPASYYIESPMPCWINATLRCGASRIHRDAPPLHPPTLRIELRPSAARKRRAAPRQVGTGNVRDAGPICTRHAPTPR
jgi:hypothetical protein